MTTENVIPATNEEVECLRNQTAKRSYVCTKCGWFGPTIETHQCDYAVLDANADVRALIARIDADAKVIAELRDALEEYGRHKRGCGIWAGRCAVIDPSKKCTCGLATPEYLAWRTTREQQS